MERVKVFFFLNTENRSVRPLEASFMYAKTLNCCVFLVSHCMTRWFYSALRVTSFFQRCSRLHSLPLPTQPQPLNETNQDVTYPSRSIAMISLLESDLFKTRSLSITSQKRNEQKEHVILTPWLLHRLKRSFLVVINRQDLCVLATVSPQWPLLARRRLTRWDISGPVVASGGVWESPAQCHKHLSAFLWSLHPSSVSLLVFVYPVLASYYFLFSGHYITSFPLIR